MAFMNCDAKDFKEFTISDNVTYIGESVFRGTTNLAKLTLPFVGQVNSIDEDTVVEVEEMFGWIYGYKGTGDVINNASYYIENALIEVVITSDEIVGPYAFANANKVQKITIPTTVTRLGDHAFYNSDSLTTVTLLDSEESKCQITNIEDYTFAECDVLVMATLPESVQTIGNYVFYNCIANPNFTIQNTVRSIGMYTFAYSDDKNNSAQLTTVTFEPTCQMTVISEGLFMNAGKLVMSSLPDSITTINDMAFMNCDAKDFKEFTISDNVTYIGESVFRGTTNLAKLTLPFVGKVNSIDDNNVVDEYEMFGWIYGYKGTGNVNDNVNYYIEDALKEVILTSDVIVGPYAFANANLVEKVVIPNTVTRLGLYAFSNSVKLRTVEFNETCQIVTIEEGTFMNCTSLEMHSLPNSVTAIHDMAFMNCSSVKFNDFTVSDKVTYIGEAVFRGTTNLAKLTLPFVGKVNSIDDNNVVDEYEMFGWIYGYKGTGNVNDNANYYIEDALIEVVITSDVIVGPYAFANADKIQKITIPTTVTRLGDHAFYNSDSLTTVTLLDSEESKCQITNIEDYTFAECDVLVMATLPESVQTIGNYVFYNCIANPNFTIQNTVRSIGMYTFAYSDDKNNSAQLTTVTFEPTCQMTVISEGLFMNAGKLVMSSLPDSITTINDMAFMNCDASGFSEFTISDNVTYIGEAVFRGTTYLAKLTLPFVGKVNSIDNNEVVDTYEVFGWIYGYKGSGDVKDHMNYHMENALKTVIITSDVIVGPYAFSNIDSIINVTIPNTVTRLGEYAFYDSNALTTVTFNATCQISIIEEATFKNCSSLVMSSLPNSVTEVHTMAFENCSATGFSEFTISDNVTFIGEAVFRGTTNLAKLTLPFVGKVNSIDDNNVVDEYEMFGWIYGYKGTGNVNDNANYSIEEALKTVIITSDEIVGPYAFSNSDSITNVTIPNTVTRLGEYAFYDSNALTTVTFNPTCQIQYIENSTFENCTSLVIGSLPNSVNRIGERVFYNCIMITSFTIPNTISSIGKYSFAFDDEQNDNTLLETVTFASPCIIETISEGLFMNAGNLVMSSLPDSVKYIEAYAFMNCDDSNFDKFTISNNVEFIGREVFNGAVNLTKLTIPFVGAYRGTQAVEDADIDSTVFGWLFGEKQVSTFRINRNNNIYNEYSCLTTVEVTDDTIICDNAFANFTYITSITLNENITEIGAYAFSNTGILEFNIPTTVTLIGEGAFKDSSNLTKVTYASDTKFSVLNDSVFENCESLATFTNGTETFVIDENITTIKNYAFKNTAFTYVKVPVTVSTTGTETFAYNNHLLSVDVDTIYLGTYMFTECHNLEKANLNNPALEVITDGTFMECHSLTKLNSDTVFSINSTVKTIEEYAFYGLRSLTDLNLPTSINTIEQYAFAYNTSITEINIDDNVTYIGYAAFSGCCEVVEMMIPYTGSSMDAENGEKDSLFGWIFGEDKYEDYIDSDHDVEHGTAAEQKGYTFYIPYNLTKISISINNIEIKEYAFANLAMVDVIEIPKYTVIIRQHAFDGCKGLSFVEIPTTALVLENQIFVNMNDNFFIITHFYTHYLPYNGDVANSRYEDVMPYSRPQGWHLDVPEKNAEINKQIWNKTYVPIADGYTSAGFTETEYDAYIDTRWHTKYSVFMESNEIFIYEYDPTANNNKGAFTIIGFTQHFMGGNIVVPDLYGQKPVIAIKEGALIGYTVVADEHESDNYQDVSTFEIGANVTYIGDMALPGGMSMIVYVKRPEKMCEQYVGRESEWIGQATYDSNGKVVSTTGNALVYYGYLDEEIVKANTSRDREEDYTWTIDKYQDTYRLITLGIDLEVLPDDKVITYAGESQKIEPKPVVTAVVTVVGEAEMPQYYEGEDYVLSWEDNYYATGYVAGYQPTIVVTSINDYIIGVQDIIFDIAPRVLTITYEDTKVYDEKIYYKDVWTSEVNNYASAGDQLYGYMYTTGQNTDAAYRTDGADAILYSSENTDYILKWAEKSFNNLTFNGEAISWNSTSGLDRGPWKVLDKNGKDITYNYTVVFKDINVEITQQPVQVYWSDLNQQFDFDKTIKLPTVQTIYSPIKLPIKVELYDLEGNLITDLNDAIIGQYYAKAKVDTDSEYLQEDVYGKVHVNYFLYPSTMTYNVNKIQVKLPSIIGEYHFTGEDQEIIIAKTEGYYKFYSDPECKNEITDFVYSEIGQYDIYVQLVDNVHYEWEDPRDLFFHDDIICLPVVISDVQTLVTIKEGFFDYYTGSQLVYSLEAQNINGVITYRVVDQAGRDITDSFIVSNILEGDSIKADIVLNPNMEGFYEQAYGSIDYINLYATNSSGEDISDDYVIAIKGGVEIKYPVPTYTLSYYEGEYDGLEHTFEVIPGSELVDYQVLYSLDGQVYTPTVPVYSNAGTYKIYYRVSANRVETITEYKLVTIQQVEFGIEVEVDPTDDLVYDNEAVELLVTVKDVNGDIIDRPYNIAYYFNDSATPIYEAVYAGRYRAVVSIEEEENYKLTYVEYEFEITAKEFTFKFEDSKDYDGSRYYKVSEFLSTDLYSGEKVVIQVYTLGTDVKTYKLANDDLTTVVQILNADGKDITASYDFTNSSVTIDIIKANAKITVGNMNYTYTPNKPITLPTITTTAGNIKDMDYLVSYRNNSTNEEFNDAPINAGEYTLIITTIDDSNTYSTVQEFEFVIKKYVLQSSIANDVLIYNGYSQMPEVVFVNQPEEVKYISTVISGDSVNVTRQGATIEVELTEEFINNYEIATTQFKYHINYRSVILEYTNEHVLYVNNLTPFVTEITSDMIINAAETDIVSGTLATNSGRLYVYKKYTDFNVDITFTRDGEDVTSNYIVNVNAYVAIRYALFQFEVVEQEGDTVVYDENAGITKITRTYNGEYYTPIVTVTDAPEDLVIYYSRLNGAYRLDPISDIDAGTYNYFIKLSAFGHEDVIIPIVLIIEKAVIDIEVDEMTRDYDGTAISPSYRIVPHVSGVTVNIDYSYADRTAYLLPPSTVGEYKAIFTVTGNNNYTGLVKEVFFEITRGDANIKIDTGYAIHVYDSKPVENPSFISFINNPTTSYTFYELVNGSWVEIPGNPTNVGEYKVEVLVSGTNSYGTSYGELEFKIIPADVVAKWSNTQTTYNGEIQVPTVEAKGFNDEVVPVRFVKADYIDAGSYFVEVASLNPNYAISSSSNIREFIIFKKTITIEENEPYYIAYNDKAWSKEYDNTNVEGIYSRDVLSAKVSTVGIAVGIYDDLEEFIWECKVVSSEDRKVDRSGNYEFVLNLYVAIRLQPFEYSFDNLVVDYNGSEQAPELTINQNNVDMTFIYNDKEFDTIPTFVNAGTYTIRYVFEKANFETVDSTITFTINKINSDIALTAEDKEYDGKDVYHYSQDVGGAFGYTAQVTAPTTINYSVNITCDDEFRYKVEFINLVTGVSSLTEPVDVGQYQMKVTVYETTNYVETVNTIDFEITKQDSRFDNLIAKDDHGNTIVTDNPYVLGLSVAYGQIYTYLEYQVIGLGQVTIAYYDEEMNFISNSKPVDSGKYYAVFTVAECDNYNGTSLVYEFEITPRDIIIQGDFEHVHNNAIWTARFQDLDIKLIDANVSNFGYNDITYFDFAELRGQIRSVYTAVGFYDLNEHFVVDSVFLYYEDVLINMNNYNIIYDITLDIVEAEAEFSFVDNNFVYDGKTHILEFDMSQVVGGYTFLYSFVNTEDLAYYSNTIDIINAGTYKVYYYAYFDNYKPVYGYVEFEVEKAETEISLLTNSRPYDSNQLNIDRSYFETNSDGTISYKFYTLNNELMLENPSKVGTYKMIISISETNNYKQKTITEYFEITKGRISIALGTLEFVYNGKVQLPVAYAYTAQNEDLKVTVSLVDGYNGKSVGTHKAMITIGNESYELTSDAIIEYEIVKAVVNLPNDLSVYYSGSVNEIIVDKGLNILNNDMVDVGVYEVQVEIENLEHYAWADGSTELIREFTYTIARKDITNVDVAINDITDQAYTGSAITPIIILSYNGMILKAGVDYAITYTNNVDVFSTAKITVEGINNYVGTIVKEFYIYSNILTTDNNVEFKYMEQVSQGVYKEHEHIIYDRNAKVLIEVEPEMTVREFINSFIEGQREYIKIRKNGSLISASKYDTTYMSTGMVVVFTSSKGATLDKVTVAVRGDISGDGYVNYLDTQKLSSYISARDFSDYTLFYAADLNDDGDVNVNDLILLQNMLK